MIRLNSENPWIDRAIAGGIFLAAFAPRIIYLYQIRSMPLFYNLGGDPLVYDLWAHRIRSGDWLGRGVFYQAPLYPYFLAGLESFLDHDLWRIRVAQTLIGAAACALLYFAGRDFFSRAAGIAAGLLLAFYAPAIFYSALIDKTVLDPFLVALLIFIARPRADGFSAGRAVAAGTVLGLLALSRENALVWAPLVPAWIAMGSAKRLVGAAWCAAGLALVLLPVGVRNLGVGGYFTPTTSQAGANFYIGNNPFADGTYGSIRKVTGDLVFEEAEATDLAEQATGRKLSPGEVSRYWFGHSWQWIGSEPLAWAKLTARKWLLAWNAREIEDSDDFYIYQRFSPLLTAFGGFDFGVLAPVAALGCALWWPQRQKLWVLYLMILTFALSVALFFIFGRYRFPVVPLLAIFAGAGVTESWKLLKGRRFGELGVGVVALFVAAAFVNAAIAGKRGPSAQGYNNLAMGYLVDGKVDLAAANLRESLRVDPEFGVAHFNLANLYADQHQSSAAVAEYRETIRLYPRFISAYNYLGKEFADAGDYEGAIVEYQDSLAIRPNAPAHYGWAAILAQHGKTEEAMMHYREAIHLDGRYLPARQDFALLLIRLGRLDEAEKEYREALKATPSFVEGHNNLGLLLARRGRFEDAIIHYRQAIALKPDFALAYANLGDALLIQGKRDEAVAELQKALEIDPNLTAARISLDNSLKAQPRK
jgi:tetratricopeptide (TPR) repeat protein